MIKYSNFYLFLLIKLNFIRFVLQLKMRILYLSPWNKNQLNY